MKLIVTIIARKRSATDMPANDRQKRLKKEIIRMTLLVIARYAPRMTEAREQRIDAVLERCSVTVDGQFCRPGGLAQCPSGR